MKPRVWLVTEYNCYLPEQDRAGLAGVLGKPFDPAALAGAVRSALAEPIG